MNRAIILQTNQLTKSKNNTLNKFNQDVTDLAKKYKADISIENLKRFSPKGKKFNKQVMRIPFYLFRKNLESRCFDKKIILNITDPYHTSKWCTHCGAVGKGHSSNYSLFKCKCGQVVNSDRKASLAIAIKPLLERTSHTNHKTFFQFSNRRVPVNGLYRQSEVGINGSVNLSYQPIESPPF
jgi:IS605 OrfB family transposase